MRSVLSRCTLLALIVSATAFAGGRPTVPELAVVETISPRIFTAEQQPKFAELRTDLTRFDESDEVAALVSVQYALAELGDGASYIWQRYHGRLSGVVQPTTSFKDASGNICRHVVIVLTSNAKSKKTETVACRLANGKWQIDG